MFNIHTYYIIESEPCLLNVDAAHLLPSYPSQVALSVGLHPWNVDEAWRDSFDAVRTAAVREDVWAIGECGLDKAHGSLAEIDKEASLSLQMEAFRAHIALAEEVQKPMLIHCVRAFDELFRLRQELVTKCKQQGRVPQPWVIHGFRGKPEQAKQIMAKGLMLSFGHHYNLQTLRSVFRGFSENSEDSEHSESSVFSLTPFFLETDDCRLSVSQIYEQVAHHLGIDVGLLDHLCDPRQSLFSR